jgi:hypothetical protein
MVGLGQRYSGSRTCGPLMTTCGTLGGRRWTWTGEKWVGGNTCSCLNIWAWADDIQVMW